MDQDRRLRHRYGTLPEPELQRGDTALLVIDLQYGDAHPDHGVLRRMRERGDAELMAYYADRLETLVIPNVRRLQDACREAGIEVIHTKIESLTHDGRDRSLEHKRLGIHHPPGSLEARFREEVAPQGDEIVLTKTCGGVFNGTNIEYVLRNLGIANLIVAGVITSGCVEVAVRDAADRGFSVTLVADGCASWSEDMERAAIRAMSEIYAKVVSTDDVVRALGQQHMPIGSAEKIPVGT
ncbi:MAG: cysteine hydrolase family protein [Thermomicrobiales bacterium]